MVNESLTLSEEATVASFADVSRLSSPPPPSLSSSSTNPQILHSNLVGAEASSTSSPLLSSTLVTSTSNTGEQVQGTQTGDSSNNSNEHQIREFTKGGALGANRKILPGPPPERLVAITNNMNSHLTSLLVRFYVQFLTSFLRYYEKV